MKDGLWLPSVAHPINRRREVRSQKVYVVLEHHTKKQDAVLHGVYANRNFAEAKKKKVEEKNKDHGYVCVLKKEVVKRKN